MCFIKRRELQRERETDRQREREADRQRQTETERSKAVNGLKVCFESFCEEGEKCKSIFALSISSSHTSAGASSGCDYSILEIFFKTEIIVLASG
jgi:hypothetical protein